MLNKFSCFLLSGLLLFGCASLQSGLPKNKKYVFVYHKGKLYYKIPFNQWKKDTLAKNLFNKIVNAEKEGRVYILKDKIHPDIYHIIWYGKSRTVLKYMKIQIYTYPEL